jgi:hypothetical protein
MPGFDPAAYGAAIADLLSRAPLNPLDAGRPDASARPLLAALADASFRPHTVRDRNMASACRAGLWLRFNYLDESHRISQDIGTAEGSFWHGILHRREGDFDNAKYWFRRVGTHPVYQPLRQAAAELAAAAPDSRATILVNQKSWDPFAFVDLCVAAVEGRSVGVELCQEVQRREWELLFDYCWRHAVDS